MPSYNYIRLILKRSNRDIDFAELEISENLFKKSTVGLYLAQIIEQNKTLGIRF